MAALPGAVNAREGRLVTGLVVAQLWHIAAAAGLRQLAAPYGPHPRLAAPMLSGTVG
jgi:hypothetical protein